MSTTEDGQDLSTSSSGNGDDNTNIQPAKKKPEDFIFGKMVGEGSFSSVKIDTSLRHYFYGTIVFNDKTLYLYMHLGIPC